MWPHLVYCALARAYTYGNSKPHKALYTHTLSTRHTLRLLVDAIYLSRAPVQTPPAALLDNGGGFDDLATPGPDASSSQPECECLDLTKVFPEEEKDREALRLAFERGNRHFEQGQVGYLVVTWQPCARR